MQTRQQEKKVIEFTLKSRKVRALMNFQKRSYIYERFPLFDFMRRFPQPNHQTGILIAAVFQVVAELKEHK